MKIRYIKLMFLSAALIALAGLNSCVKSRGGLETDFTDIQDFVIFQNGGLVNFAAASITAGTSAPDTIKLNAIITLASKNVATTPITVTIGVDDAQRINYNGANGTSYIPFPSNLYKIITPTVTIPAGQSYATVSVQVYARNADAALSYLLPLTITDASGKNLSGNLNTLYYHIIGNPLAGPYTVTGTRYNYTGNVSWAGPPNPVPAGYATPVTTFNETDIANAIDSKTVQVIMGNVPEPAPLGGSAYYYVTGNASFSSISYNFTSNFQAGYSGIQRYVISYMPPSPTQKASFHLMTKYTNAASGGSDRIVDQTFVHQ